MKDVKNDCKLCFPFVNWQQNTDYVSLQFSFITFASVSQWEGECVCVCIFQCYRRKGYGAKNEHGSTSVMSVAISYKNRKDIQWRLRLPILLHRNGLIPQVILIERSI